MTGVARLSMSDYFETLIGVCKISGSIGFGFFALTIAPN